MKLEISTKQVTEIEFVLRDTIISLEVKINDLHKYLDKDNILVQSYKKDLNRAKEALFNLQQAGFTSEC